jgi:hypothetical protein
MRWRASPLGLSRVYWAHAKPTTTLGIYAHLFADDHTDAMAALGAMSRPVSGSNVVPLLRGG